MKMRKALLIALSLTFLGSGSPSVAVSKPPAFFGFVASLCSTGTAVSQRISKSSVSCTAPGLVVQVSLLDRADLVLGGKSRAREQLHSCVFELERTQTTSLGVSSDADYIGVGSRLSVRDLNGVRGQVLLMKVSVLLLDVGAEPKGTASLAELRRVLREFDDGARKFFAAEDVLRPVDC